MVMTPTEEAALRTALAERERRLAEVLVNPMRQHEVQKMRDSVERLRKEIERC